MHEFSIAASLVENVLAFAEAHPEGTVLGVRLLVGELAGVEAAQLQFCYESLTTETVLAGSELEIELLPALVRCPGCQYEGPPHYWENVLEAGAIPTLQCPQCGKAAESIRGHECEIRSIRFLKQPAMEKQSMEGRPMEEQSMEGRVTRVRRAPRVRGDLPIADPAT